MGARVAGGRRGGKKRLRSLSLAVLTQPRDEEKEEERGQKAAALLTGEFRLDRVMAD